MADADRKSPTIDSLEAVSEVIAEHHDEHEASNVVQGHEPTAPDDLVEEAFQPDTTLDDNVKDAANVNTQLQVELEDKPGQPTPSANHEATKNSPSVKRPAAINKEKSAKAASGKPSPLSPTVKKVCMQCGQG